MKFAVLTAAAFACLTPAAAFAQTAPAPAATPAPAPATKFSIDTPIETLVADPAALAVLAANGLGDVAAHPAYESFKALSLRAVQPMSGGALTEETLAKVEAGLTAIK